MDINAKFNELLVKHGIIKNFTFEPAADALSQLEQKYCLGEKIGLYGCGKEADGLMTLISNYTKELKIECCFDQIVRKYQYRDRVMDRNVIPVEKISEKNIDCVIIGSYRLREEFIKNLSIAGYKGEIFDLYEYLDEYIQDYYSDYEAIYNLRQAYKKETLEKKAAVLRQLIKNYLLLKDFLSAFDSIDLYCKSGYTNYEKYIKLKQEIHVFLDEVLNCINARKEKDIIINWVDAVSYYDLKEFPFLHHKVESGVCFENAYTVMPWTTETKKTILYGEYPIEGKLFLREKLEKDNTTLIQLLEKNGYDFGYCGLPRITKMFDASVVVPSIFYENKYVSSLQKQWNALAMLCMSQKPMCILIHTLYETHEPYICGEGDTFIIFGSTEKDWKQEECQKQAAVSGAYIDKQLAFYESFYGKDSIKIYMSDHGRVGNSPFNEKKIHVVFSVNGADTKNKKIDKMFSLVNFPKVIETILDGRNDWEKLTDEYVLIENLDAYDERVVTDTLSGKLSVEEMYQCRGIVTEKDKYFLYAYGKEYYFKSRTSEKNEIDNPVYAERIAELRNLCGKEFIDIYQYEKFKYSRLLYKDDITDILLV